jgi:tetratricopeptide (TPR) repeat protein
VALPFSQIASQLIAEGELAKGIPYLEKSARCNPNSAAALWSLVRVNRLLGRMPEVERNAEALLRLNPNYAPLYTELGQAYEAAGDFARAAEAYDAYVLLAPNFADTAEIRGRAQRARARTQRPVPSLRKK